MSTTSFIGIVVALVLGAVVGGISGVVGIGGGVVLVPLLAWLYGMDQKTAQGTSIATLLAPIGALAFWQYYRTGHTNVRIAMWIALGFLVGGWIGGLGAQRLSELTLRRIFAGVLIAMAVKLLWVKA